MIIHKIVNRLYDDLEAKIILLLILFTLTVFMCDKAYKDGYNSHGENVEYESVECEVEYINE